MSRHTRTACITVFAAFFLDACPVAADLILTNGRIVTGTAAGVIEKGNLYIKGAVINSVSAAREPARDVPTIDVTGMTVLPGLIDAHAHLFFDRSGEVMRVPSSEEQAREYIDSHLRPQLAEYLERGFTTIVSPLDFWPGVLEVRRGLLYGEIRGPRLLAAGGIFTGMGEHPFCKGEPWCIEHVAVRVQNVQQARDGVQRYVRSGVDLIVFDGSHPGSRRLPPAVVAALVDETHLNGLRIFLHGMDVARVDEYLELGFDGLLSPPREKADKLESLLTAGAFRGLPFAITVEELVDDEVIRSNILGLLQHGAVPVLGPDLLGTGISAAEVLKETIEAYSDAGMSNETVLLSATRNAAKSLLGLNDLGVLEAGALADVLVVRGNPVLNLQDVLNTLIVIQRGKIVVDNR